MIWIAVYDIDPDRHYLELTHYLQNPAFVNYVEGIYAGYRFYETAAAEGLIVYERRPDSGGDEVVLNI